MTQNTEQERAEFEAAASNNGKWPQAIERDAKGDYLLMETASGWRWWQETWLAARRAPVVPVISEAQVLAITTAYEQGVGKGHQSHALKEAITNPYGDEWGCDIAWQMGYDEGREQAERKAAPPPLEAPHHVGDCENEACIGCMPSMPPVTPEEFSRDIAEMLSGPVQMPEPYDYVEWRERGFSKTHRTALYTEKQVRQLLAAHGVK